MTEGGDHLGTALANPPVERIQSGLSSQMVVVSPSPLAPTVTSYQLAKDIAIGAGMFVAVLLALLALGL